MKSKNVKISHYYENSVNLKNFPNKKLCTKIRIYKFIYLKYATRESTSCFRIFKFFEKLVAYGKITQLAKYLELTIKMIVFTFIRFMRLICSTYNNFDCAKLNTLMTKMKQIINRLKA